MRVSANMNTADIDSNADSVILFVDNGYKPGNSKLTADNYKLCASASGAGSCSVFTSTNANQLYKYSAAM